jgi:hypothetical protein
VWSWAGGLGPQVPGNLSAVDLGTYGSVASECNAKAGTFTARSGSSLLVTAGASAVGNDYSVRVNNTANLAGRVWLLGVSGGASTLPANLDVPVLSCATANGFFDLIQTDVPPPAGKFLTLVPSSVNGRTVFSLRLLDLPGNAELTGASTGSFSGTAVAAETIDIDHDGFDDLALAIDFGAGQPGLIQILLNDGAGNLGGNSVLKSIPAQPTCMAVGDVNNDGKADVVVGIASDNSARVYLDNGASALVAGRGDRAGWRRDKRDALEQPDRRWHFVGQAPDLRRCDAAAGDHHGRHAEHGERRRHEGHRRHHGRDGRHHLEHLQPASTRGDRLRADAGAWPQRPVRHRPDLWLDGEACRAGCGRHRR